MMGRKPRLAVDLNLGTNLPEFSLCRSSKYIQDLERRLQWSYKLAQEHMRKQAEKAKKYYDRRVRCSKLEPGDLVLVKRFGFRGRHKIQDRWENQVYEVLESCHSSPLVFRLRREDGTCGIRTLHRNHLLPFRTKILEEETSTLLWNWKIASKLGPLRILSKKIQETSEDEEDPMDVLSGGDNTVSARPWTRSQGPPPALVGTQSLSKCSLNSTSPLLPKHRGVTVAKPKGYAGKLLGWATSLWGGLHPW